MRVTFLLGGMASYGSRRGKARLPSAGGIGSGELFDVDLADAGALVGDGEGAADQEGFLGDDVLSPGLDGGGRDVIFRVGQGERLRLGVVEQEFDFKRAFHGGDSFRCVSDGSSVHPARVTATAAAAGAGASASPAVQAVTSVAFSARWMSPTSCDCRAARPWPTASRSSSLISGLMELNVRVAYLTAPASVVPFSTLILREVVMFVRCVAMIVLLSGERVGASAGSREAGRLPEAQERFPLP